MDKQFSKRALDRAGKIIRLHQANDEYCAAVEVLNRWREQHILPMDFYFDSCNNIASNASIYKGTVVAERLKRLPTIIDKLDRFPHMHLSGMQDIGGVRVILEDIKGLTSFEHELRLFPELKSSKDYLTKPKSSGYRGYHLIFEHDGMTIEVQLRTQLQHLWATSVETVDVIRGTSMKTKQYDSYWQEFFGLASSAFAYMEELPILPQHQDWDVIRLRDEIRKMLEAYPIEESLRAYAATYEAINGRQGRDAYYTIIAFDPDKNKTAVAYYSEDKYQDAVHDYEKQEASSSDNNNVLVSVSDLKKLHDAYPNYFKSISEFANKIKFMLDLQE